MRRPVARESNQEQAVVKILHERFELIARKDGRQGWPDRLVLFGVGRHVWVEHKSEVGRLTPAQKRVFARLEAAGDTIVYGRGKTAEQIIDEVLAALGRFR